MDDEECRALLSTSKLGVLALSDQGRAYAIPLYYAFDGEDLWFHCHPGLKDEYLEKSNEVCLVVIHVGSANIWESVQVFGTAAKVTLNTDVDTARAALAKVPFPPAEGNYPRGLPVRSEQDVYYVKLKPRHIEGKKSAFATPT